ncbi:hypothetical protein AM588_10003172 [Phytophthora nicotianae]|uniref:Uncharacterized protein n=1 Tax=Phytophthora nicotianae TaxID=4792 RepID=A0A0W8CV50_PHYNI|nr:hypothetical protein AM588_10003172 [Phytophthora nicotianae]
MGRVFSLLDRAMAGSDQEAMQNTFRNALEMLVTQPWNVCSTWHAPRTLRFFLVLFEHPSMFDPDYLNVVGGLCRLFFYLSDEAKALVREQWMNFYSADELHRLLDILQQAITVCLYGSRKMDLVYAACGVLAELHVVNRERVNGTEPFATYDEFYNDAVNSEVDVVQDYSRSIIFWKKRRAATRAARRVTRDERRRRRQLNEEQSEAEREREERERELEEAQQDAEPMPERQLSEMSFCDFPFVLDAASKSKVLQIDSDLEQQDAMQQLVHLSTSAETLKKPLKVKFVGEEGIDEGGVQKEFFQILIRQLLDPAYGMFTYDEETRTLWFNSDSLEVTMEFELIGTLLGLAIYNAVILDVSFPHIVYKKLMGCTLGLEDLELALPDLGRGLRQLLNFEGDVEGVYQRNFEYSYEVFGEVKTVELKPGGSSIPVTNDNREEYVALYVDYVLNRSVSRQYAAFHHGFHQVCNDEVLSMFRWEELQLLICGSSDLDFEALEEATHYEDGFTDDSTIIRRGVAFVQFARAEDCAKAVAKMDKMPLEGMKLAVSLSRDNGRSREFAKKRKYTTSQRCFECGELGHVSYECPRNVLGTRERPVTTGGKSSRKNLKKKKKKFDPHERAHYFNDEGVTNILAPPTGSDDEDFSISLLAYPSTASSASSAPPSVITPPVSAASAAISARRRPQRKADSYFSDEDASDDE